MAIDFSQVKTITIPEGSVKKITDSNGAVLWKEYSPEWHTIWEGNKTVTTSSKNISGTSNNFVSTVSGTGNAPRIRVTFTTLYGKASSPSVIKYFKNTTNGSGNTTTKPTSPMDVTLNSGATVKVLGVQAQTTYQGTCYVYLVKTNNSTTNCSFSLKGDYSGNPYYNEATMTITKIEQYY